MGDGPTILDLPASDVRPHDVVDEGRVVCSVEWGEYLFDDGGGALLAESRYTERGVRITTASMWVDVIDVDGQKVKVPRFDGYETRQYRCADLVRVVRDIRTPQQ